MDWLDRNSTRIAIIGIIVSCVIGLAIAIHAGSDLRYADEHDWTRLAMNLVTRHAYTLDGTHLTAFRPPGYPLLLAVPAALGVHITGLRIFNVGIFAAAEVFLFLLARLLFSRAVAAIAVLLVLFYPVLTYTATLLLPQTFGAMLLLLGTWLLLRSESPKLGFVILAGVVWGMLLLSIPTFLFVFCGLAAWLWWKRPAFRRSAPALAATVALVLGAWTVRNYKVFHTFVFVATSSGINLLQGNSPSSATLASILTGGRTFSLAQYTDAVGGMNEAQQDEFYKKAAFHWMREHPGKAIALYALKLVEYFKFAESTATENFATRAEQPFWRDLIMLVTYGPLLLVFLCRLVLARRYPLAQIEALLAGLYFLNAPFAAIFYTRIRYRLPMDWLLLLFDASAILILMSVARTQFSETEGSASKQSMTA